MRLIITLLITLLLTSCSHNENPVPPVRPGVAEETESPELSDNSMRIYSPLLTMRYDDGGILFSRDDDGTVSAVRLSDDCRFEFDPSKPSLRINGATIPLTSAELAKETDGCRWYRLLTYDSKEPTYIVIAGL